MAELSDQEITGRGGGRFRLVPTVRRWVRMFHDECGSYVNFVPPINEVDRDRRVHWYADHHDCDANNWMVGG